MPRTTGNDEQPQHPMVAVPEAILTVLVESCRQLLLQAPIPADRSDGDGEEIFLYDHSNVNLDGGPKDAWQQLQGRVLLEDVRMRSPGYPPYAASIMDGYAVSVNEDVGASSQTDGGVPVWTHIVKDKIYAGGAPPSADGNQHTNVPMAVDEGLPVPQNTTTDGAALNDSTYAATDHGDDDDDDDIQSATSSQLDFEPDDDNKDYADDERTTTNGLLHAYYVTTGAMIPNGCNAVIPIEHVTVHDTGTATNPNRNLPLANVDATPRTSSASTTVLSISPSAMAALPKHNWIRQPGSDIAPDTLLVPKHTILDPVAIGLLYQSGVASVLVRRKINIGILSTGSELFVPNPYGGDDTDDWWTYLQEHRPGMIPDINRPMLLSLFSSFIDDMYRYNINVVDLGIVRDDDSIGTVTKRFEAAIEQCDIVISTGGISLGETDFVENIIRNHVGKSSELHFGRLHMKPGKPTTFFTVSKDSCNVGDANNNINISNDKRCCLWFAMPGNPVSNYVCTQLLVFPALHLLVHGLPEDCPVLRDVTLNGADRTYIRNDIVPYLYVHDEVHDVVLQHDIQLDPERPEYHRVIFVSGNTTSVRSTGVQQSSRLLSMQNADGVVVLPQGTSEHPIAKAGEKYTLLLLFHRNTTISKQVRESKHVLSNIDTSLRLKQPLASDTAIVEPESQPSQPAFANKPVLNVGIVQISPVYVVDTIPTWNESKSDNDVNTEFDKQEATTDETQYTTRISERVERALSGNKSGPVQVVSNTTFHGTVDRLYQHLMDQVVTGESDENGKTTTDILVVIGTSSQREQLHGYYRSPFHRYMQISHMLRQRLEKMATSMSLFAKQNAAKQDPIIGALFEIVIGYMYTINMNEQHDDQCDMKINASSKSGVGTEKNIVDMDYNDSTAGTGRPVTTPANGCIVIFVPEECLDTSLGCIRSVIKHALQIAR